MDSHPHIGFCLTDPGFVPTAVALALWSSGIWFEEAHPEREVRPTRAEYVELYREVAIAAPVASAWAGYDIPPEIAWVFAHHERHNVDSCHNCDGGSPGSKKSNGDVIKQANNRAGGFFGITVPAVERWGRDLGKRLPPRVMLDLNIPKVSSYKTRDAWTKAVCLWLVNHPREQVWIFFRLLAFHLRENAHGNLYDMFAIYKGPDGGRDYAWIQRDIWQRRGWTWPRDGQLRAIR